jgi:hypothetical protein
MQPIAATLAPTRRLAPFIFLSPLVRRACLNWRPATPGSRDAVDCPEEHRSQLIYIDIEANGFGKGFSPILRILDFVTKSFESNSLISRDIFYAANRGAASDVTEADSSKPSQRHRLMWYLLLNAESARPLPQAFPADPTLLPVDEE